MWIDRWELNVGDSLVEKVESALSGASAILVLLSKNSVGSEWCRKELNSGLIRELGEKKVILLPCVIEDCDVPLFLRDELYADFRSDPDVAIEQVKRSLARISNPHQARSEAPRFHTDWSLDWKGNEQSQRIEWTFVDHGADWPYVVQSQCIVVTQHQASRRFSAAQRRGEGDAFMMEVLEMVIESLPPESLSVWIRDAHEQVLYREIRRENGEEYFVSIRYRRLGEDSGFDTVVHLGNNFKAALRHMKSVGLRPQD